MKKIVFTLAAVGLVAALSPLSASAQTWRPIAQRKADIDRRIDVGVRTGSLTRAEASNLRTRFANLQRLEWRYRRNGLSYRERVDLDSRCMALSTAVSRQRHDRQTRRRRWGR